MTRRIRTLLATILAVGLFGTSILAQAPLNLPLTQPAAIMLAYFPWISDAPTMISIARTEKANDSPTRAVRCWSQVTRTSERQEPARRWTITAAGAVIMSVIS